MVTDRLDSRLRDLGIRLPSPPKPLGSYVEAVRIDRMLYLSGMLPVADGKPAFVGRVGAELSVEEGKEAARMACLNGLSVIHSRLGAMERVGKVVKLGVYIASTDAFRDHPQVADGASDLIMQVFGREMLSGRIVLGVVSLPLGSPVEVELVVEASA